MGNGYRGMGNRNRWGSRVQGLGYSGYQPHGQWGTWGNRVQGVWAIGVYGAIGVQGYGVQDTWAMVQGVWATWGNRVQGVWVQGYGHMGQ